MEDTRAEALPIGAAEAAAALQTLQRYKTGKAALDKRIDGQRAVVPDGALEKLPEPA